MPEIFLTPDMLTETASKMDAQQQVIDGFLKNVDSVVENLLAGWKGDAQTAFANSWAEKRETYKTFAVDISKFSQYLRTYAQGMQDIDMGEANRVPH